MLGDGHKRSDREGVSHLLVPSFVHIRLNQIPTVLLYLYPKLMIARILQ